MQVFQIEKAVTRLAEGFRSIASSKAVHGEAVVADTGGQRGEIAIAGHEAETVESAAVQQIHRFDDELHVSGVFAGSVGKLLHRHQCMAQQHVFFPALRFWTAPIAVNTLDAGNAQFGNLCEKAGNSRCGSIIRINKDGEFVLFFRAIHATPPRLPAAGGSVPVG